jgi:hypothetical protein
VNAADLSGAVAPAAWAQPDPPERAIGRCWLAVTAAALVTGAYAAPVVIPAGEISPVPIAGIAPSYGPKTVSAVPNAAAIVRRIWLPGLDKDLLVRRGVLEGWYDFSRRSEEAALREWCAENGIDNSGTSGPAVAIYRWP